MQSLAAAIPFVDDVTAAPATAWAYRRRARRLRHRFRNDPAALHASLRTLATEVDAAAPPPPTRRHGGGARHVVSHVVRPASGVAGPADQCPPPPIGDGVRGVLNAPAEAVDRFAVLVRSVLDEGQIRYSRRQSLARRADRLGIGRFEASLIIAAVEHRHRTYAPHAGRPAAAAPPAGRRWVAAVVAGVLLLESAALIGLWAFL